MHPLVHIRIDHINRTCFNLVFQLKTKPIYRDIIQHQFVNYQTNVKQEMFKLNVGLSIRPAL